ncbi:hypothetical protein EK599_07630 [Vibrio sp. T187]|uniref:hypothetical protein n=1 Tax=Vibrio TaxID=662 RepID=UPI0010C97258|nr:MULTISPECIES: hypothetical protein [Vibrio]MBW3695562.1 hypothetical protein [Vibrio sp. T187]
MHNSNSQQRKHAFWSIVLTGLVIITCLASTITSSSTIASSAPYSPTLTESQISQDTHIQVLYQQVFDSGSIAKPLPSKEACTLSEQLLTYATPKLDWLAAYIILSILVYCLAPLSIGNARLERQHFAFPKQRLHVTYCIFRE